MKKIRTFYVFGLLALMFACRTAKPVNPFDVLQPISESRVNAVQQGITDKANVMANFGNPLDRVKTASDETYLYTYFGDSLTVRFGTTGIVNAYTYSPEAFQVVQDDLKNGAARLKSSKLKKVYPGHTHGKELMELIGLPTQTYIGVYRNKLVYQTKNEKYIFYLQKKTDLLINYTVE